jgi:hypothetical protein
MKWILRWLRKRHLPLHRPETPGQRAATHALERTRHARVQLEDSQEAATEVSASLQRRLEKNHFAEMFRIALEGDR